MNILNADPDIRRPTLVPHARFRWDELRQEHQIVYPEGMLVLNESAAKIVRLCDGRSTDELIADLQQDVTDENLAADVRSFLVRLVEKGLLCDADQ